MAKQLTPEEEEAIRLDQERTRQQQARLRLAKSGCVCGGAGAAPNGLTLALETEALGVGSKISKGLQLRKKFHRDFIGISLQFSSRFSSECALFIAFLHPFPIFGPFKSLLSLSEVCRRSALSSKGLLRPLGPSLRGQMHGLTPRQTCTCVHMYSI